MMLFLFALAGLRLEVGKPQPLPPDVRVVRVFPEDLVRVEGDRVVPLRGGAGVLLVKSRQGIRPFPVEVRPFRETPLRRIPPRVVIPPGETLTVIPPGTYAIRTLALPEDRLHLDETDGGVVATCTSPGRSVVFYELRKDNAIQFGRTLVVCLPGTGDMSWWKPLYLKKGEVREVEGLREVEAWAQGGVVVRKEEEGFRIEGVEPGRGALVVARPGKGRVRIPVYVDIPPLFPPQVLTLPVDRLNLPPDVDSVKVFPEQALRVYLDGTVEVLHPVPLAHVEVWKDGRVGVITLIGHRPPQAPDRRFRPRRQESPFRRPR